MNQLLRLIGRLGKRSDPTPKTPEADRLSADHPLMSVDAPPAEDAGAPVVARD